MDVLLREWPLKSDLPGLSALLSSLERGPVSQCSTSEELTAADTRSLVIPVTVTFLEAPDPDPREQKEASHAQGVWGCLDPHYSSYHSIGSLAFCGSQQLPAMFIC